MLSGSVLCDRLPHVGSLCLLDRVVAWDDKNIRCTTTSHRHPANPLRNDEGLSAVSGVEYAAQAMAVHGSLVFDDPTPRAGFLAGLRDLQLEADWLHDIESELHIIASKVAGDKTGAIYDFRIETDHGRLLSGRATLMYAYTAKSA